MKTKIPMAAIGVVAVVALVIVAVLFIKGSTVEPTAKNLPDYTKMSGADIAKQREASMEAERGAKRP